MSSDRIMAEEPIEKKITRILIHRKMTVTAAESCTGGLVAGTLVNADGISEVFKESYVTYSNEAKHKLLGVKKETLEKYGAVSRQTAAEMAEGAVRAAIATKVGDRQKDLGAVGQHRSEPSVAQGRGLAVKVGVSFTDTATSLARVECVPPWQNDIQSPLTFC